jgi:hypothetical protein
LIVRRISLSKDGLIAMCVKARITPRLRSVNSIMQTFTNNTKALYASSAFAQKEEEAASFLSDVSPYVGGRPTSLENMVRG